MTLPFKEEIVNDKEYSQYNFEHPHFIGYLNKYGEVLDYSRPLGLGGHNDNKLTTFFESYFRMPENDSWIQQIENRNVIDLEEEKYYAKSRKEYFKEKLEYISSFTKKYGITKDPYKQFENDLNFFFYNCYQANTFIDGFGQNSISLNKVEFIQKYCEKRTIFQKEPTETEEQYRERRSRLIDYDYYWYKKNLMLDWYKAVIVQYMHYHLITRCEKGIVTSDLKPTETFYNYLLNDFKVYQIPCMIYDNTKKTYVQYKQNQFLISDSELRLQEEIQAIKKLVPLKERTKYYR